MNPTLATPVETQRAAKLGLNNSMAGVACRAASGFSRAGILLLIASTYGPLLFGKLALAISVMEIFRTFSEFGIDTIAIRRFAQEPEQDRGNLLSRTITSKLVAAVVCYLISLVVTGLIARDTFTFTLGMVAGISLFSGNLIGAFTSYYQSQLRMVEAFLPTFLAFGLYIVCSSAAIFKHAPLLLVIMLLPLFEMLDFLLLRRKVKHLPPIRLDLAATLSLFRESWPVGLMGAMIMLYFRLDNILIFKFIGNAALGLYAASFRIVEPALMVPHAFSLSLFAIFAGHGHLRSSRNQMMAVIGRTMWPAYAFIIGAAAALILGGQSLLRHFGAGYINAYPALQILAIVLVLRTVNITLTAVLNSRAKYSLLAKITGTNLIINVVLALMLIPHFGIEGAAWAAFGTELWNMLAQGSFAFSRSEVEGSPVYGLICPEPECE